VLSPRGTSQVVCHPRLQALVGADIWLTLSMLDFLVRLSVKRLPSPQTDPKRPTYTLVPDGLQHPKFKGLDSRKGHYVVCRRAAMQQFEGRGTAFPLALSQMYR
jgi:hypothetical protein